MEFIVRRVNIHMLILKFRFQESRLVPSLIVLPAPVLIKLISSVRLHEVFSKKNNCPN